MMSINSTTPAKLSLKDRASFKLISLFIGTFLAVFIGSTVISAFTSLLESQVADAGLESQPTVIAIDPKIESNLAKVMSFNSVPESADIKDPFNDPSGLSNNGKATVNAGTTNQTAAKNASSTGNTTLAKNTPPKNQAGKTTKPSSNVGGVVINAKNDVVTEDTLIRIMRRDEKIRQGLDGGSESAVFAIEDLLPVGVVSGGEGADEVIFYSQSACRNFSYPVGTQVYDGWLTELRPEGVVFSLNDQPRTVRLKSWVKSLKPTSCTNSAVVVTPNQITTGGTN